jgi:hypothetical protein
MFHDTPTNSAIRWRIETVGDSLYIMELFQSVDTLNFETMRRVNGLPGLEFDWFRKSTSR